MKPIDSAIKKATERFYGTIKNGLVGNIIGFPVINYGSENSVLTGVPPIKPTLWDTKIGKWKGQDVEELEKPELLELIIFLSQQLEKIKKEVNELGDDYFDLLAKKKLNL
jgi:hypothetical protein